MEIFYSSEEIKSHRFKQPHALVPTMGNLHEGHLSLVKYAKNNFSEVITSIFVNPLQFGENEDFSDYPRTLDQDIELLENVGCDYLFVPEKKFAENLKIIEPRFSDVLCGLNRPNHFHGVITIVDKFLKIIEPNACLFGMKDYQQQLIIKDYVKRFDIDTKILSLPTVREKSGLAMSSRNNYLTELEKENCGIIYSCISKVASKINQITDAKKILHLKKRAVALLEQNNFEVDYLEVLDAEDLSEVSESSQKAIVAVAVKYKAIRLIDNIVFSL